jgi:exosortase/archaeosortase family protein
LESALDQRPAPDVFVSSGLSFKTSPRTPFCIVLLLTCAALVLDYSLAPSLYNGSTLWATGTLLILALRSKAKTDLLTLNEAVTSRHGWRLTLFALFHLAFVLLARILAPELQAASSSYSISSSAIALTKFLVLLPTIVLLPPTLWRRVAQVFRPELLASLVVLATFFPQRLFATLWPWYSQILGRVVYSLGALFVPSLTYVVGPIPSLVGPKLDVSIIFQCSGIDGVKLFQPLFGLVAFVEWKWIDKRRALIAYLAGLCAVLAANSLRISLLVILGNRGLTTWVTRYHGDLGWVVFTLTFLAFLWIAYDWMLSSETASNEHNCHAFK